MVGAKATTNMKEDTQQYEVKKKGRLQGKSKVKGKVSRGKRK